MKMFLAGTWACPNCQLQVGSIPNFSQKNAILDALLHLASVLVGPCPFLSPELLVQVGTDESAQQSCHLTSHPLISAAGTKLWSTKYQEQQRIWASEPYRRWLQRRLLLHVGSKSRCSPPGPPWTSYCQVESDRQTICSALSALARPLSHAKFWCCNPKRQLQYRKRYHSRTGSLTLLDQKHLVSWAPAPTASAKVQGGTKLLWFH